MVRMIDRELAKLRQKLILFCDAENISIDSAERQIAPALLETAENILGALYEEKDREIFNDKALRKQLGLKSQQRNQKRCLLTMLGSVSYHRTSYRDASGAYVYPVDQLIGVESRQRISNNVCEALVSESTKNSYHAAAMAITGGRVSRATVLHKIREAEPKTACVQKKSVPVLHIDADEDHIKLQNGKSKNVPLISVYEGIDRANGRGSCRNIFHIAEYGKNPEALWEQALEETERRYDLSKTKVYLHGDGAAWIKTGTEWFSDCTFVLDRYHANKALKQSVSGISAEDGRMYQRQLRKALYNGDEQAFSEVQQDMLYRYTDHAENIWKNTEYLRANMDAISVYSRDSEAFNGGATEPHVSHKLSSRLSTRPMAWSETTLKKFVPIIAAGGCTFEPKEATADTRAAKNVFGRAKPTSKPFAPNSLGAPNPDFASNLLGGKITPLYRILRNYV